MLNKEEALIIRKLILSNWQPDGDEFYLYYGVYTLRYKVTEEESISDVVNYFLDRIYRIHNMDFIQKDR